MTENKLKFAFAVHNHQPVGNFNRVLEQSYNDTYLPFLEVMDRFPNLHFSLHITGFLLEWLLGGGQKALDIIRGMVERGQVEILTGTYYEAIIPLISQNDAVSSIIAYSRKLEEVFGVKPRGMWLAERVYEPHLPEILAGADVEYIALDDWHFKTAGISTDKLDLPWVAREHQSEITILPISQKMRYLVPFAEIEDVTTYLKELHRNGVAMVCLADDGEKFGGWPGTYKHCYEDKWLEKFAIALTECEDWLDVCTLGEVNDALNKRGPAYLPNASYYEMGRWAMTAEDQVTLSKFGDEWNADGEMGHLAPGAPFRSFLNKYPEINYLHKRMSQISRRLQELEESGTVFPTIRRSLWRSQANDAYWHGVFGGLYLPHLRRALYENMLGAEAAIDRELGLTTMRQTRDLDGDGELEIAIKNSDLIMVAAPAEGLAIKEISSLNPAICFSDTLSRRFEPYHNDLSDKSDSDEVDTIHSVMQCKEDGLEELLVYDKYPNRLARHIFVPEGFQTDDYFNADVADENYFKVSDVWGDKTEIIGSIDSPVFCGEKSLELSENGLVVKLSGDVLRSGRIGCEFSLNFWSPDIEHSSLRLADKKDPISEKGAVRDTNNAVVCDELSGWEICFVSNEDYDIWYYPIYTVSRSEGGYEKVFQGAAFLLSIPKKRAKIDWSLDLQITT